MQGGKTALPLDFSSHLCNRVGSSLKIIEEVNDAIEGEGGLDYRRR
jgi:hypothetical protein